MVRKTSATFLLTFHLQEHPFPLSLRNKRSLYPSQLHQLRQYISLQHCRLRLFTWAPKHIHDLDWLRAAQANQRRTIAAGQMEPWEIRDLRQHLWFRLFGCDHCVQLLSQLSPSGCCVGELWAFDMGCGVDHCSGCVCGSWETSLYGPCAIRGREEGTRRWNAEFLTIWKDWAERPRSVRCAAGFTRGINLVIAKNPQSRSSASSIRQSSKQCIVTFSSRAYHRPRRQLLVEYPSKN